MAVELRDSFLLRTGLSIIMARNVLSRAFSLTFNAAAIPFTPKHLTSLRISPLQTTNKTLIITN